MRIECKDGDLRSLAGEIATQCAVKPLDGIHNAVGTHLLAHFRYREVSRQECHTNIIIEEDHLCLLPLLGKAALEILRMTRKIEILTMNRILIDGCRNEHVDISIGQCGHGGFEGYPGGIAAFGSTHAISRLYRSISDIHHVYAAVGRICGRRHMLQPDIILPKCLKSALHELTVGEEHRRIKIRHTFDCYCLKYCLQSHAISITLRETYS